jgi:Tfp pilus assembly protein PilF
MRKIGLRLRSASVYRWLSEVEASHNSFRIAIVVAPQNQAIKYGCFSYRFRRYITNTIYLFILFLKFSAVLKDISFNHYH